MSVVLKAAQLAEFWHRGQIRKYTNRPYIEHPIRVAGRVASLSRLIRFDDEPVNIITENHVAAAFLHDVIEDCDIQRFQIDGIFETNEIADIVEDLTNPSKNHPHLKRSERKLMDREHLRNATNIVKIIKMVDRIDNINEMRNADVHFIVKYCEESILLANVIGDASNELYRELMEAIISLKQIALKGWNS